MVEIFLVQMLFCISDTKHLHVFWSKHCLGMSKHCLLLGKNGAQHWNLQKGVKYKVGQIEPF